MKRFSFKLDPVLRYRSYRTKLALLKLAEAKQQRLKAQRKIERIRSEQKSVADELVAKETEGMNMGHHRLYGAYLSGLDQQKAETQNHISQMDQLVVERRDIVKTERIRTETLERLKDKQEYSYSRMVEQSEQKEADELVTLRFRKC